MSRKPVKRKRRDAPDPVWNDKFLGALIRVIMKGGKKSLAEKICYGAMDHIKNRGNDEPVKLIRRAIDNVRPAVEVKSRRVGGASYQVPVDIRPNRSIALALRWLVHSAKARDGRSMAEKLANEFMSAANASGAAFKKKEDTHRMAEANRAFAHYRW